MDPPVQFSIRTSYGGIELSGAFEAGKRYQITFMRGLKTENGALLRQDIVRSVTMPDLNPSLRFKTRGTYMASHGSRLLPLETINVGEAELTIERIYNNNLVHFMKSTGR